MRQATFEPRRGSGQNFCARSQAGPASRANGRSSPRRRSRTVRPKENAAVPSRRPRRNDIFSRIAPLYTPGLFCFPASAADCFIGGTDAPTRSFAVTVTSAAVLIPRPTYGVQKTIANILSPATQNTTLSRPFFSPSAVRTPVFRSPSVRPALAVSAREKKSAL